MTGGFLSDRDVDRDAIVVERSRGQNNWSAVSVKPAARTAIPAATSNG